MCKCPGLDWSFGSGDWGKIDAAMFSAKCLVESCTCRVTIESAGKQITFPIAEADLRSVKDSGACIPQYCLRGFTRSYGIRDSRSTQVHRYPSHARSAPVDG